MSGYYSRNTAAAAAPDQMGSLLKDIEITAPKEDSIADLAWSPVANHLAVASWDSKLRIYDVSTVPTGTGVAQVNFDGPVLSCDWSKDGYKLVGCGADKTAKVLDLNALTSPQQVALHDAPIRVARFVDIPSANAPMLVTGSWDKTVKYWDLRTPNAVASLTCQDRVYVMDAKQDMLVIGTADRYINVVDLKNPTKFKRTEQSPLKFQTRAISCFKDAKGYMIGSIEGRAGFQHMDPKDESRNMTFKCHREGPKNNLTQIYAINAISTHPIHGTFSTAGSDGGLHFWDKEARIRLKGFPSVGGSITATGFSFKGDLFAYAISYDWHKGHTANKPDYPIKIMVHTCSDLEIAPRLKR